MKAKTKRGSSTSNAQHPTPNAQRGTGWKNRIVGHGEVAPGKLAAHPENYKAHPERQAAALGAALDEIGYLRSVTVNRRTGTIVDWHLRVAVALKRGERTIPVEYVDLSPAEERAALAALDPIGNMAEVDDAALDALIGSIAGGAPALADALKSLRLEQDDEGGGAPAIPDTFQIVVTCRSVKEQRMLVKSWTASGIQCKAVTF